MSAFIEDSLCRLISGGRIAVAGVCAAYLIVLPEQQGTVLAAGILILSSWTPWRYGVRAAGYLLSRPLHVFDAMVAAWGWSMAGPASPFGLLTLAGLVLAGMLFGHSFAAVVATMVVAGMVGTLLWSPKAAPGWSLSTGIACVGLCVIAALAGWSVRGLLLRLGATQQRLLDLSAAAGASEERAQLARDLHDSLGKTLHGIGLTADALARWTGRDIDRAAQTAATLSSAAAQARLELRHVIRGLRGQAARASALYQVQSAAVQFSARTGIDCLVLAGESDDPPLEEEILHEVLTILNEALANAERHAGAGRVTVTLVAGDADLTVTIATTAEGLIRSFRIGPAISASSAWPNAPSAWAEHSWCGPGRGTGPRSCCACRRAGTTQWTTDMRYTHEGGRSSRSHGWFARRVTHGPGAGGGRQPSSASVWQAAESSGTIDVVAEAKDGNEAIELAHRHQPDVILLDVRMPGRSGIDVLGALAGLGRVLMVTGCEDRTVIGQALRDGATGYLVHGQFGPDQIVQAVLDTAAGRPHLSPAALTALLDSLRSPAPHQHASSTAATEAHGLSKREAEIMEHIVRGRGNNDIARTLYLSEKTVKNHINRIYAKLSARNRAEAIALWLGLA